MKTVPPETNPPLRLIMNSHRVLGQAEPDWIIQAPQRDMWLAATVTDSYEYEVSAADFDASARFDHRSAKTRQTVLKRPLPVWARYPAGVIITLGDAGMDIPGFHAVTLGDEPSGPRYDFAMGVVFAAFCYSLVNEEYTASELIDLVERVRRNYVEK